MANQLERFKINPYGIEDLVIYQGYIDSLYSRIDRKREQKKMIERDVLEVRNRLLRATREKKMLENVRSKHKNRHEYEIMRKENTFFDDIGAIRTARKLLSRKNK